MKKLTFFIVAMPGCGNLGDDLISYLLVEKLRKKYPGCYINCLAGRFHNPLENKYADYIRLQSKKNSFDYLKIQGKINNLVNDSDAVIIGGGGLVQDHYHYFTMHNRLKYAYTTNTPAFMIGIGMRQLKNRFSRKYLKKTIKFIKIIQVRDKSSAKLMEKYGGKCIIDSDIVAGSKIDNVKWLFDEEEGVFEDYLGVSLGNHDNNVLIKDVNLLESIAKEFQLKSIKFFVFEYTPQNLKEYNYNLKLAKKMKSKGFTTELVIYNNHKASYFFGLFKNAKIGLATRYHANILWQKFKVPVIPIAYAPKVKNLYKERNEQCLNYSEIYNYNGKYSKLVTIINLKNNFELPEMDFKEIKKTNFLLKYVSGFISIQEYLYCIGKSIIRRIL